MRRALVLTLLILAHRSSAAAGSILRLGTDVVPLAETVRLELDARRESYSGSVEVALAIRSAFAAGCSGQRIEAARAFFSAPEHDPPGTDRELAKVVEGVENCLRLNAREGEAVRAYVSSR